MQCNYVSWRFEALAAQPCVRNSESYSATPTLGPIFLRTRIDPITLFSWMSVFGPRLLKVPRFSPSSVLCNGISCTSTMITRLVTSWFLSFTPVKLPAPLKLTIYMGLSRTAKVWHFRMLAQAHIIKLDEVGTDLAHEQFFPYVVESSWTLKSTNFGQTSAFQKPRISLDFRPAKLRIDLCEKLQRAWSNIHPPQVSHRQLVLSIRRLLIESCMYLIPERKQVLSIWCSFPSLI